VGGSENGMEEAEDGGKGHRDFRGARNGLEIVGKGLEMVEEELK
jgi:hypothetical protein